MVCTTCTYGAGPFLYLRTLHKMNRQILKELEAADEFFPFNKWPPWAKHSFLKAHKNRNERMHMFVFLWKNGLRPQRAIYWTMRHGGYDRSAWRSIQDLAKKTESAEGRAYLNRIPVLDMHTGRVHRV